MARADGVTTLEKRALKVRRQEEGTRWSWMGWIDPSGHASDPDYKPMEAFPLELESGDVLLFSVRFTKKPKILGVEMTETHLRRDYLELWAGCQACGSNDTPCPEV